MDALLEDPWLLAGAAAAVLVVLGVIVALSTSSSSTSTSNSTTKEVAVVTERSAASSSGATTKKKKKKKAKATPAPSVVVEQEEPPAPEPAVEPSAATTTTSKKKKKKPKKKAPEPEAEPEPEPEPVKKKKKKNKKKKAAAETEPVPTEEPVAAVVVTVTDDDDDDDDEEDDDDLLLATFAKGSRQSSNNTKKSSNGQQANDEGGWSTIGKKNKTMTTTTTTVMETSAPEEPTDDDAAANSQPTSVTVPLDDSDVPILIGPKGATIQQLQSQFQVKLDVSKDTTSGSTKTVTISGTDAGNVAAAQEQVQVLLALEKSKTAHTAVLTAADDIAISGSVQSGVKAMIGRGGTTIRSITQQTQCKLDANIEAGTVHISGPSAEAVQQAVQLCRQAVHGESQSTVDLKSRQMVLQVCGKGLVHLKQWQDETGCRFDFVERGGTVLKITGDTDKIAKALALVTERLALCKGDSSLRIPADKIGAVYGKGGTTLRHIQETTGASVEIEQAPVAGAEAVCSIVGEPAAVATALEMVQKAMAGEVVELKPGEVVEKLDLGVGVSAVIGRGGSKLQELEATHKVKVNIGRGTSQCTLVGQPAGVEKCQAEILSIVTPLIEKAEAEAKIAQQAAQLAQNGGDGAWAGVDESLEGW